MITIYQPVYNHASLEDFRDSISDQELLFLASEFISVCFESQADITEAVERAIMICKSAGIPVRSNFKPVYTSIEGEVYNDWRLSVLGRKLVILNANPANPIVAKIQLELIHYCEE